MPHINIPTFKYGKITELDTDQGWMKVTRQGGGGGSFTYFFDSQAPNHHDKMENLRLWFLERMRGALDVVVPQLTVEERKLILQGASSLQQGDSQ